MAKKKAKFGNRQPLSPLGGLAAKVTEFNENFSNIFIDLPSGGTVFGSWIDEDSRSNGYNEDDVITNPAYVIESVLRDVLSIPTDQIDYASFDVAGNDTDGLLDGWKFNGGIYQVVESRELLTNMLLQCKSRLFRNPDGKFSMVVYDSSASVDYSDYKFDTDNNIGNVEISRTNFEDIAASINIKYDLDRGANKYRGSKFVWARKEFSGTYLNEALDATEFAVDVDDGTKFTADDYTMVDREINRVSSISTNTLTLYNAASARTVYFNTNKVTHDDNAPVYIITKGSNDTDTTKEDNLVEAIWKYNAQNKIEIEADWIADATTAELLRDYYYNFYRLPHWVVDFTCTIQASNLRVGNIIEFNDTVMDSFLKLGGESWSGKVFRVESINRVGNMLYNISAIEI